jgi:hypothetical protein
MRRSGLLYPASVAAAAALDDLYDFAWPTAIALWNFRWQLAGYVAVHENATENELAARFISGSRINPPHSFQWRNLKQFSQSTWDDQRSHLARFLLQSSFSVFESYLGELRLNLGLPESASKNLDKLPMVYDDVKRIATSKPILVPGQKLSPIMETLVYPAMVKHQHNGSNRLDHLLGAYWAAKCVRNTVAHGPGPIALKQLAWLRLFLSEHAACCAATDPQVESELRYGVRTLAVFDEVEPTGLPRVTLPPAVALSFILRQLIYIYDAEHMRTEQGLKTLIGKVLEGPLPDWLRTPWSLKKGRKWEGHFRRHGILVDLSTPAGIAAMEELDRLLVAEDLRQRPPKRPVRRSRVTWRKRP